MKKITALRETLLKKENKDSSKGDFATVPVNKGKEYKVKTSLETDKRTNHAKVELDYGAGIWWIYLPHWEIDDPKASLTNPDLSEVDRIIMACKKYGLLLTQAAYVLATFQHETNGTYQPVIEAYWLSEAWRKANLRYYPWYGRGHVQLTWEPNYDWAVFRFNRPDIKTNPNVILTDFDLSVSIGIIGMMEGQFGKPLTNYVNKNKKDYYQARRSVNILDKAQLVANYAQAWEAKLKNLKY